MGELRQVLPARGVGIVQERHQLLRDDLRRTRGHVPQQRPAERQTRTSSAGRLSRAGKVSVFPSIVITFMVSS